MENYDYPLDASGTKGINYTLGIAKKGDTEHGSRSVHWIMSITSTF